MASKIFLPIKLQQFGHVTKINHLGCDLDEHQTAKLVVGGGFPGCLARTPCNDLHIYLCSGGFPACNNLEIAVSPSHLAV